MTTLRNNLLKTACAISSLSLIFTTGAAGGEAEDTEAKIARALSAAPESISAKATVMDVDGAILRQGSNGWTCLPGVGLIPGDKHPMCNDAVWMAWMKAASTKTPFTTDKIGISYMLQGDALVNNDDPAATDHTKGVWIQEGPHLMLLMPRAMTENFPRNPFFGGPYVMWGDTPLVHIMVPVGDRSE